MTRKIRTRRKRMPDFNLDNFTKQFGKPRKFKGTLPDAVKHTKTILPTTRKRSKK